MHEEKINIVHLNIVNHSYYTGIDRYIEVYDCIASQEPYCNTICVHKVLLTNHQKVLFPVIEIVNDSITAIIPSPANQRLLFEKTFWKERFMRVISEILIPYFSNKENLIFQYHNLFLSTLAETLREQFGGKVLAHLHCLAWKYNFSRDNQKFKELYKLYYMEKFEDFETLENADVKYEMEDKIICLSETAQQYIANVFRRDTTSISIVPNGMEIIQTRKNLKRNSNPVEILYAGKVAKDKGVFDLLAALNKLKKEEVDFTLKLAGTILPETVNLIRENYRDLKIDILGQIPLEQLKKMYMTCTIGVIPSLFEQCSYVAIEMAMYGVPMIVSDVDALSEMFEHEKTALLTPLIFDNDFGLSCDRKKLAENLLKLINDDKLRAKLSENVRKMAENKFSVDTMMCRTLEVYKQLLNEKA